MAKAVIDEKFCKGCGLCFTVCPKKLLKAGDKANAKGYYFAVQTNDDKCTACSLCAIICPDAAITVYK